MVTYSLLCGGCCFHPYAFLLIMVTRIGLHLPLAAYLKSVSNLKLQGDKFFIILNGAYL